MNKNVKIWISLGQGQGDPHYYAHNEKDLKAYLDHLNKIGFNAYSYDEDKARGFVQEYEIPEKRFNKIERDALCYLWSEQSLIGSRPNKVVAMSDTMNHVATIMSNHWNHKVSKKHLLTQYMCNPEYGLEEIPDWNVKKFNNK